MTEVHCVIVAKFATVEAINYYRIYMAGEGGGNELTLTGCVASEG